MEHNTVLIEVTGGVAEVTQTEGRVDAYIIDWDHFKEVGTGRELHHVEELLEAGDISGAYNFYHSIV